MRRQAQRFLDSITDQYKSTCFVSPGQPPQVELPGAAGHDAPSRGLLAKGKKDTAPSVRMEWLGEVAAGTAQMRVACASSVHLRQPSRTTSSSSREPIVN